MLDHARNYAARQWSIIAVHGKQPVCPWKEYQQRCPSDAELQEMFARTHTGLAVILGPVSGRLVARDFDIPSPYHDWAAAHPDLAITLPTVQTRRGFHVYFRADHDRILHLGDGEFRGAGYCLLPPSEHAAGSYSWTVPLPDGEIQELDPVASGLLHIQTQQPHHTHCNGGVVYDCVTPSTVEELIRQTLPQGPGGRNNRIWHLAIGLKRMMPEASATELKAVVQRWHALALPRITTKDFTTTWADFVIAWPKVSPSALPGLIEAARSMPLPPQARQYDDLHAQRLVCLCHVLAAHHQGGPFPLSSRVAGQAIGTSHNTAAGLIRMLMFDGIIIKVADDDFAVRRAAEYRLATTPPAAVPATQMPSGPQSLETSNPSLG